MLALLEPRDLPSLSADKFYPQTAEFVINIGATDGIVPYQMLKKYFAQNNITFENISSSVTRLEHILSATINTIQDNVKSFIKSYVKSSSSSVFPYLSSLLSSLSSFSTPCLWSISVSVVIELICNGFIGHSLDMKRNRLSSEKDSGSALKHDSKSRKDIDSIFILYHFLLCHSSIHLLKPIVSDPTHLFCSILMYIGWMEWCEEVPSVSIKETARVLRDKQEAEMAKEQSEKTRGGPSLRQYPAILHASSVYRRMSHKQCKAMNTIRMLVNNEMKRRQKRGDGEDGRDVSSSISPRRATIKVGISTSSSLKSLKDEPKDIESSDKKKLDGVPRAKKGLKISQSKESLSEAISPKVFFSARDVPQFITNDIVYTAIQQVFLLHHSLLETTINKVCESMLARKKQVSVQSRHSSRLQRTISLTDTIQPPPSSLLPPLSSTLGTGTLDQHFPVSTIHPVNRSLATPFISTPGTATMPSFYAEPRSTIHDQTYQFSRTQGFNPATTLTGIQSTPFTGMTSNPPTTLLPPTTTSVPSDSTSPSIDMLFLGAMWEDWNVSSPVAESKVGRDREYDDRELFSASETRSMKSECNERERQDERESCDRRSSVSVESSSHFSVGDDLSSAGTPSNSKPSHSHKSKRNRRRSSSMSSVSLSRLLNTHGLKQLLAEVSRRDRKRDQEDQEVQERGSEEIEEYPDNREHKKEEEEERRTAVEVERRIADHREKIEFEEEEEEEEEIEPGKDEERLEIEEEEESKTSHAGKHLLHTHTPNPVLQPKSAIHHMSHPITAHSYSDTNPSDQHVAFHAGNAEIQLSLAQYDEDEAESSIFSVGMSPGVVSEPAKVDSAIRHRLFGKDEDNQAPSSSVFSSRQSSPYDIIGQKSGLLKSSLPEISTVPYRGTTGRKQKGYPHEKSTFSSRAKPKNINFDEFQMGLSG
ncbi:hypothetical protein ADUPG1_009542 [Aduncisulcus paluster]|uniref:Uncharacterized protein n=1 Tax=Aduncisulcus paluster TaxID=2918883 RepID=A0ABQ5KZW0_9EUKA|nr:hypothetical protein ADUPG1_009542 [Aduncisulcus paluster]